MENQLLESEKKDEELVSLSLKNSEYFFYIVKRYEEKLLRFITRISAFSHEDAEDALQDVFIKVYKNLNDFDLSLKFSSWIYRIARNHVISLHRKKIVRPEGNLIAMEDSQWNNLRDDFEMENELDQKFLNNMLAKVLDKISSKYRDVIILRYLEQKNYEEISDILKKSKGTIATQLSRAKKEMKKIIIEQEKKFSPEASKEQLMPSSHVSLEK